jgi:hypothetical protein
MPQASRTPVAGVGSLPVASSTRIYGACSSGSRSRIGSVSDEPGRASEDEVERVELLAEWHGERASLGDDHLVACQAMLAVGIALREVAEALDAEWGEEGKAH